MLATSTFADGDGSKKHDMKTPFKRACLLFAVCNTLWFSIYYLAYVRESESSGLFLLCFFLAIAASGYCCLYYLAQQLTNKIDRLASDQTVLQQKLQKSERLAESKSNFLANMSHEIRTPMNGVLGLTEVLLESNLDQEQQKLASTISQSGKSLLSIINDILDYSKVTAGKLELSLIPFNIRDRIALIESILAVKIKEKNINLVTAISESIPKKLIGDPDRLQQVLINLVGNSIKFTEDGGGIILLVEPLESSDKKVRLHFSVSDSGVGIEKNKQQEVFSAYAQEDASTARNFGGTGLGLSISKEIITLMKGNIELRSIQNRGTTFSFDAEFEVATVQDSSATDITGVTQDVRLAKDLSILLVEDNKVNQFLMKKILLKQGCNITFANNGKEAVEYCAAQEPYDLILMDIQMPIMGGEEATRLIRTMQEEKKHTVPIIALTAHAMDGDREKYLAIGMDEYVSKPINQKDLLQAILKVCPEKRPH